MTLLALLRRIGGTVVFMVGVVALAIPIIPGWLLIGVGLYLLSVDSPGMQQRIIVLRARHRHLNMLLAPVDRLLGHTPPPNLTEVDRGTRDESDRSGM